MKRRQKDTMSDYVTNTQSDTIILSKTQINIQEDQPNKRAPKKPMIQRTLQIMLSQKKIVFTGSIDY